MGIDHGVEPIQEMNYRCVFLGSENGGLTHLKSLLMEHDDNPLGENRGTQFSDKNHLEKIECF